MNKKKRKTADWRFYLTVGLLVLVLLIGAGNVSGAFDLKAKLAEILLSRIDTVIEQNLAASIESLDVEEAKLGGLVEIFQKMFPEGLIIGEKEKGMTGYKEIKADSSGNMWIGTSSDATFKISSTGRITLRNINFVTSTLNWGGDFGIGTSVFYADITNNRVGIGTSTPAYTLEVARGATTTLALTSTSTDVADVQLQFNKGAATQVFALYFDDSANTLVMATSSAGGDLFTLAYTNGAITIAKNLAVSGTLGVIGVSSLATTTVAGPFVSGGNVWSTTSAVASVFTAAQICDNSVIQFSSLVPATSTPNVTMTVTLPTAATLHADCLSNVGYTKRVTIINASTTWDVAAPPNFTLIKGTGINLVGDDLDADIVTSSATVILEFTREDNTTTTAKIIPLVPVD